jgi:Bacterial Ig-like domain (group 3)/MBG domain (YGX type)/PQQ-like domain
MRLGQRFSTLANLCLLALLCSTVAATAQVNIYQRGYNNSRTNANLQETILTPANVNPTNFGKLFTVPTDGQIYASPLYVANLSINGGTHNVLYVATMFNTIYALDADTGVALWSKNYGYPIIAEDVQNNQNIDWRTGIGILSTPVIDPSTNIMYFVNANQPQNGAQQYSFKLNALDITTGDPVHGSPVTISATYSNSDTTSPAVFNAKMQNQRPGLTIANGNVYIAFGSRQDQTPYYGWVMSYSESTLAQMAVYVDTPMDGWGGIWNAGQAPVVDSAGNLYFTTGNGAVGSTPNNNVQAGSSFVKLSPTLQLLDYFTPSNASTLNSGDMDLGSAGIMLIPNTNYLLGGGKQGVLYVVNTGNMTHFNASGDKVQQEFQAVLGKGTSHIHGTPVYFNSDKNGPTTYVWGENDVLRGFLFNQTTGLLNTTPFATSTMTAPVTNNDGAMPGGFLSISANGNSNGILWASTPYNADAVVTTVQGVLYAFNADTLQPLWSDKNNDARDEVGYFAKFVPPTVANGKVYVPTFGPLGTNNGTGALVVYGLLHSNPTLTVNVANETMPAGNPLPTLTGTVSGLQNGDTLGNQIIVTYSTTATSNSPAGNYPITATVTGSDANNYQVVVDAGTLTITQPTQTLTVTANNATRAYGAANPTFTGTITGAQNGNTFTESFSTTATTTSNVGNYPIIPAANGNNLNNYNVVIVDGTLDVTAANTTTALSAPGTSNYGSSITLVATVTSSAGIPAGTVTFYSGSNALGTGTLNGSGVAMLNTTALGVGTDSITASYAAAGNFAASTSTASSVTVSQASQTITFPAIGSRPYGSAPFAVTATSSAGSSYPVTITVQSGPAAISGGVVTLTGVGTVVLQATQAGNTNYSSATTTQSFQVTPAPLSVTANNASRAYGAANPAFSGTVTGAVGSDSFTESFTTTATTTSNVGSYPIVPAVTGPQSNYTITYVNGALTVTGATTTTTLGAPGTASYGANVALTATVSSTAGTPGGIVTFFNGSTTLGTGTLNAGGVATLSTTTLPVGTDAVSASYAATGNFAASTSTATNITVSTASQTITFPAVPSRTYGSAPFAVSATSSLGSSYPVTVSVLSGPALMNGGLVTITGAGTVVLQASQAGDSNYGSATTTQSFQVLPAQLTVTAGSSARSYGAVNPAFSGTITGAVGSDSFTESFTTTATANSNAGSYPIVPAAAGPALGNYTVVIVNGTLTVSPLATSTTITAAGSASYGASVTLTATVSSTSGTPAGLVTFLSGSTPLGSVALNAGGTAVLSTTALPAGTDTVTANFAAQGNYGASTAAASITINEASQTINFPAIASRPYGSAPFAVSATSSLGSSYPVTISVASGPATISGGLVSITGVGTVVLKASQAGNSSYGPTSATESFQVTPAALTVMANNGTRLYGAANPDFTGTVTGAMGSDTFNENFSSLATIVSNVGTYAIVPTVSGPALTNYTVTVEKGTLTVTPAATATTLSAPGSAAYGAGVTLTATVASTAGTPGGTVTFYSGSTSLGAGTLNGNGVATLSTTTLSAATNSVTAVYAAAGNFATSTSAAVTIALSGTPGGTAASYSMSANPSSLTVKQGAAANTSITFTPAGGFSGTVALSCSNVPSNVSCVFAQNKVTLTGNNQSANVGLTLQTTIQKTAVQQASSGVHLPTGLLALAFYWPGSLTGIAVFLRKRKLVRMKLSWQVCLLLVCALAFAAGLSGCGVSGFVANPTPGNVQVTVVATGTAANAVPQTLVLSLNITQ